MSEPPLVDRSILNVRASEILSQQLHKLYRETDRAFAVLMAIQWAGAIVIACCISPVSWNVTRGYTNPCIWAAVLIGGAITIFPIAFALRLPGHTATRHIVAIGQLLMSGLLIALTGGRIETHFHIFGSLAFLAFYRDWRVLVTASLVTVANHVICGYYWPESMFGTPIVQPWRWAEHAGWVLFTDIFLIIGVLHSLREKEEISRSQAYAEFAESALRDANERLEHRVQERTDDLATLNGRLLADIDARCEVESALRSSEARYQRIAEKVPGMVFQLVMRRGGEFDFVYVGDGVRDIFGYEPAAVRESPCLVIDALRGDDPIAFDAALRESATTLCAWEWMTQIGAERWVRSSSKPERLPSGDMLWDGLILDITQQRVANARQSQAMKMESIGQLAAGIAHEINTPTQYVGDNTRFLTEAFGALSSLVAEYVGLAAESETLAQKFAAAGEAADLPYLLDEIPRTLDQTRSGIAHIAQIAGAMTEFSHPGSDTKVRVDINRSLESAATVATNTWKYVALLEKDLPDGLPPVFCFPGRMSQVWLNIIVNAAHAIADAGESARHPGRITLSTRRVGDCIEARIGDSGTGIEPSIMPRIFDPFFTTKAIGRGTGQGLSIVHSVVVEQHGGTVQVESEKGRGTTFIVRLPIGDEVQ